MTIALKGLMLVLLTECDEIHFCFVAKIFLFNSATDAAAATKVAVAVDVITDVVVPVVVGVHVVQGRGSIM